jgi:MFS family permease
MIIIGAVVTGTAKTKATFIGGRFLTGFGSGCAGASAKSFLGELTSPQYRGLFMGFLNCEFFILSPQEEPLI